MTGKAVLMVLALSLATALLVACGGGTPSPASKSAPAPTSGAKSSAPKAAAPTPAPKGDGTLKIDLNILNPEQKQDQYNVFFTAVGAVEKGRALSPNGFHGPFTIDTGEELSIDIEEDLKSYLYRTSGIMGPMEIDLVVTRIEDTHIRNPLCDPLKLTFDDEFATTGLGNEITVAVTDSALNDLWDEEVFLVKVVPPQIQDGGGYPTIDYGKPGSAIKSQMQRGSAGPDFLVAFPVADFKKKGIREARLVIMDSGNKARSEAMPLTFDENGHCDQGPLVMIKTTS